MAERVSKEPAQRVIVRKKQRFFDLKLVYYTALAVAMIGLVYSYPPGAKAPAVHGPIRPQVAPSKSSPVRPD